MNKVDGFQSMENVGIVYHSLEDHFERYVKGKVIFHFFCSFFLNMDLRTTKLNLPNEHFFCLNNSIPNYY